MVMKKIKDFFTTLELEEAPAAPPPEAPPVSVPATAPGPAPAPAAPPPEAPPVSVPATATPAPATAPEPVVATAAETIIPPAGVVTSAAPTGEAMYMAMSPKELAELAEKEDPGLMKLLREPVTGTK